MPRPFLRSKSIIIQSGQHLELDKETRLCVVEGRIHNIFMPTYANSFRGKRYSISFRKQFVWKIRDEQSRLLISTDHRIPPRGAQGLFSTKIIRRVPRPSLTHIISMRERLCVTKSGLIITKPTGLEASNLFRERLYLPLTAKGQIEDIEKILWTFKEILADKKKIPIFATVNPSLVKRFTVYCKTSP